MSSPPPWWIAVAVLIPVIGIANGIYVFYKRRRRIHYSGSNDQQLEEEYMRQLRLKDARLATEVEKRKKEEGDTTPGTHVWFSRYVKNGRFKHWVLGIGNTKYELRRDKDDKHYYHNINREWSINKEKLEASRATIKKPVVDGYYLCVIGWTTMTSDELDATCEEVMKQFGTYHLLWNNCQDFVQQFADRIIVKKALDWDWFRTYTKTEYQEAQAIEIPTPQEIRAANARQRYAQTNNLAVLNQTQQMNLLTQQQNNNMLQSINQQNMLNQQMMTNNNNIQMMNNNNIQMMNMQTMNR